MWRVTDISLHGAVRCAVINNEPKLFKPIGSGIDETSRRRARGAGIPKARAVIYVYVPCTIGVVEHNMRALGGNFVQRMVSKARTLVCPRTPSERRRPDPWGAEGAGRAGVTGEQMAQSICNETTGGIDGVARTVEKG